MQFFPIVSVTTGRVVTGCSVEANANTLATTLNKFAGREIVRVESGVPSNPSYSKTKDPERVMLTALRDAALGSASVTA